MVGMAIATSWVKGGNHLGPHPPQMAHQQVDDCDRVRLIQIPIHIVEERRLLYEAGYQVERAGPGSHLADPAGSLALGQQRVVEIARALAGDPLLLLLDEPAAGLRLRREPTLAESLSGLRAEGMSILLVERDMEFVMGMVDRQW